MPLSLPATTPFPEAVAPIVAPVMAASSAKLSPARVTAPLAVTAPPVRSALAASIRKVVAEIVASPVSKAPPVLRSRTVAAVRLPPVSLASPLLVRDRMPDADRAPAPDSVLAASVRSPAVIAPFSAIPPVPVTVRPS